MFVHLHAELLGRSFRHSDEAFGDEVVVIPCLGVAAPQSFLFRCAVRNGVKA